MTDHKEPAAALECPFCGCIVVRDGEVGSHDPETGRDYVQSECSGCGALGPRAYLSRDEVDYGDVKSTAAWNQRPPKASAVPVVPEGWQLVPKELTLSMLPEAWRIAARENHINHECLRNIYRAMLAAAPSAPQAEAKTEACAGFQGLPVNTCGPCEGKGCDAIPLRVQPSIDTPDFWDLVRNSLCMGVGNSAANLVAHIDAKRAQAHEEGFAEGLKAPDTAYAQLHARAEKAEAQLAAIRAGLEGLQRHELGGSWDLAYMDPQPDGEWIMRDEALALLNGHSIVGTSATLAIVDEYHTSGTCEVCACGGTGTAFGKRCECGKGVNV